MRVSRKKVVVELFSFHFFLFLIIFSDDARETFLVYRQHRIIIGIRIVVEGGTGGCPLCFASAADQGSAQCVPGTIALLGAKILPSFNFTSDCKKEPLATSDSVTKYNGSFS